MGVAAHQPELSTPPDRLSFRIQSSRRKTSGQPPANCYPPGFTPRRRTQPLRSRTISGSKSAGERSGPPRGLSLW